ncbi:MAG: endolytic transglycosylase MltG [Candidatus Brennerbacteria bacterium]|nr:endolytic transglycosylase MltG [Candidatus Brennerbacteria bacterium]
MRYFIFAALLCAVFFCLFFAFYFLYSLKAVAVSPDFKEVKIARGEGLKEISSLLFEKGAIKSVSGFRLYAFLSGSAHMLKPGFYKISPASTTPEIVSLLVSGPEKEIAVVIPEGSTVKEIERILAEKGVLQSGAITGFKNSDFLASYPFKPKILEGFLYPDTYRFEIDSDVQIILKKFLDNFEKRAWPLLKQDKNWFDRLITASILEKEVADFEERRIVAGIMNKRLKNNLPLQLDATIVYFKCGGDFSGCSDRRLSKQDFEMKNSFNTYKRLGLPETPIGNPGESAIKAALSPKISPYLYYLSDPETKKTIFSKTFEEHNENRFKYLNL